MDCARCGTDLAVTTVTDEQELTCSHCGTVNCVSCGTDDSDEADAPWIGSWTCCHGVDGEEPCVMCDAEDAADA